MPSGKVCNPKNTKAVDPKYTCNPKSGRWILKKKVAKSLHKKCNLDDVKASNDRYMCNPKTGRWKLKPTTNKKYKDGILMFYSKSKEPNLKYLSNFEPSDVKIKVYGNTMIFPSIEHGFQAMKYVVSDQMQIAKEFEKGEKYGFRSPKDIKKEGGKMAFKKRKVSLKVIQWEENKLRIMKKLVNSRYTSDAKFRHIVDKIKSNGYKLFHYEGTRGRRVSYWGGSWPASIKDLRDQLNFNGENMLGKLIMKARINNHL